MKMARRIGVKLKRKGNRSYRPGEMEEVRLVMKCFRRSINAAGMEKNHFVRIRAGKTGINKLSGRAKQFVLGRLKDDGFRVKVSWDRVSNTSGVERPTDPHDIESHENYHEKIERKILRFISNITIEWA